MSTPERTAAIPTSHALPLVPLPSGPAAGSLDQRARALAELQESMRRCRLCVDAGYLARADTVAGQKGRVTDRVMVVGQAPGHLSVERGLPFSGPGGKVLQGWLVRAGFAPEDFRRRVYISALTRCDPGPSPRGGGDRKPSPDELALCRPYLLRELELLRPRVILLIGGMAIAAFLGPQRLEDVIGTGVQQHGVHLLPLPHPSGVSRWLNDARHQALLARALDLLAGWRAEMDAEPAGGETAISRRAETSPAGPPFVSTPAPTGA
jgi:uracil-DNA glycosylase family 4